MQDTNISEFGNGEKVFRITPDEMADTPVSPMLCSNFLELGFGYQAEGMWSEMLFNRSFEKSYQLTPATYDWFGGIDEVKDDWRGHDWYHSGYEHNRWYACPAQDGPSRMAPDSSFLVEHAPFYSLTVTQAAGGVHGTHCLCVDNFEPERWCGVAQNGKYLRKGAAYRFRGWMKADDAQAAKVQLRFYAAAGPIDWQEPAAVFPLEPLAGEWKLVTLTFTHEKEDGWYAFALFTAPGTRIYLDAFSLRPQDTVKGWRRDVVDGLRRVNPKLIRFPGGCFASLYDWRNAIGPFDRRKPEPSYFWGDINYNDVGTDEFLQLCEQLGCEAMLVVNIFHPDKRTLLASDLNDQVRGRRPHGFILDQYTDAQEGIRCAAQWVEYCNGSVETEFGALRAANGHPEPYGVKYWEMDNEAFRWYSPEDYAKMVVRYARAMKAVDPTIQIGLTSYYYYSAFVREMLDICGNDVDFLADRVCEPDNLAAKIETIRRYNQDTGRHLYYTDTEALQNRDPLPGEYIRRYYEEHAITYRGARRTWIYALNLVSNLMMDQRYGGQVRFMCFNNLANTSGQSCIETPKEQVVIPACGLVYERMSRSEAAWPLYIEGYEATSRKPIEIQAAWNRDRSKLVIYLLNRCHMDTAVSFDLSGLGKSFQRLSAHRMRAAGGAVQETVKSQGNIQQEHWYADIPAGMPASFQIPAWSFTELTLD